MAGCLRGRGVLDTGGGYGANFCAVSLHQQVGGHPGASDEDLTQPGAPGEASIRRLMDHGQGERRVLSDWGYTPQDRPACLGSPLFKTPRCPPSDRNQL